MTSARHDSNGRTAGRGIRLVEELDALRLALEAVRTRGERIALVPTMGNLHEGHLELVRAAHRHADWIVATIFVNPFQFSPNEDFDSYPRTFERDMDLLARESCNLVFAPRGETVYPRGPQGATRVTVPVLGDTLEGASRPGFFTGVATVVNILFNMVQPHVAMFGEKDYQQLLVVRRMVDDLRMSLRIEAVPTVREPDGLAMSSRNSYLSAPERERAPEMFKMLCALRDAARAGESDHAALESLGAERLANAGFRPDYVVVRRQHDLEVPRDGDVELIALAAAWLGKARLIDNLKI